MRHWKIEGCTDEWDTICYSLLPTWGPHGLIVLGLESLECYLSLFVEFREIKALCCHLSSLFYLPCPDSYLKQCSQDIPPDSPIKWFFKTKITMGLLPLAWFRFPWRDFKSQELKDNCSTLSVNDLRASNLTKVAAAETNHLLEVVFPLAGPSGRYASWFLGAWEFNHNQMLRRIMNYTCDCFTKRLSKKAWYGLAWPWKMSWCESGR